MKRKFCIGLFLCLSLMSDCFAQDPQPTLQQTLDWITLKIRSYSVKSGGPYSFPNQYFEVHNCTVFNDTYNVFIEKGGINRKSEDGVYRIYDGSEIDLNDITSYKSWDMNDNGNSSFFTFYTKGNKVKNYDVYEDARNGIINKFGDKHLTYMFSFGMRWDAEPDLENRFKKALDKLVSFNTVKQPKEAY